MRRIDIETKLNRDRAWLLDTYAALSEKQLHEGLTPSEHDPSNLWSALDHLAHLALIEHNFAGMVRKHVAGDANPVGLTTDAQGNVRSRADIMASVHAMTEQWQHEHAGKSLSEVVALGQNVRSAEVGDRVLFSPDDRYEVEVGGNDYIMLRERDLHAVAASRIEASTGLYL